MVKRKTVGDDVRTRKMFARRWSRR